MMPRTDVAQHCVATVIKTHDKLPSHEDVDALADRWLRIERHHAVLALLEGQRGELLGDGAAGKLLPLKRHH